MRGRNAVDPELARVVELRLERLLAERGPRRAAPALDDDGAEADPDDSTGPPSPAEPERLDSGGRRTTTTDPPRRPAFTRAHLVVIGILVVLGVLLGGWAVLRAQPVPLSAAVASEPRPDPAGPSAARASVTPAASPATTASVPLVVHVVGAVRRPGLAELSTGARVQDAIEAAGGTKPGARLGDLNLAQPLADGQQVVVGEGSRRSEVRGTGADSTAGVPGTTGSTGQSTAMVDLNTATQSQLETLPGVGPVTAAKILAWRQEHGRFSRVEELQEVSGIGPKTYAEIAPHCRV